MLSNAHLEKRLPAICPQAPKIGHFAHVETDRPVENPAYDLRVADPST